VGNKNPLPAPYISFEFLIGGGQQKPVTGPLGNKNPLPTISHFTQKFRGAKHLREIQFLRAKTFA